jgi:hypothetical protein
VLFGRKVMRQKARVKEIEERTTRLVEVEREENRKALK